MRSDCQRLEKRTHELRREYPTRAAEEIYAELVDTYGSLVSSQVRYGTTSFQYREGQEDHVLIDTIYVFLTYEGVFAWWPLVMVKTGSNVLQDLVTNDVHEEMTKGEREMKVEMNNESVCVFAKVPRGERSMFECGLISV